MAFFVLRKKDCEITLDTEKKLLITGEKEVGVFRLDDEHCFDGSFVVAADISDVDAGVTVTGCIRDKIQAALDMVEA